MSSMTEKNKNIAIAILIGGRSARFGSDKGIFEFLGKAFISYQLETLSKLDNEVFIVARSKNQIKQYIEKIDYRTLTAFILDDRKLISDHELHTPMIGLYSAFKELDKLGHDKVFALSCDNPLINFNVVDYLIKQSKGFDCCIPKWKNGFLEPLFAIYPVNEAFKMAEENIKKKEYKLTKLLDKNWNINYISVEESIQPLDEKLLTFINVNGPTDIKKLMKIYKDS